MADGTPVVAEPEVMDVHQSLLNLLEGEEGKPEDTQTEAEPETEQSGEAEAQVDAEEQPEQAESPKTWKVKVDGEEVDVPEDELVKGYSRQQDYTRKTMKLAEERKALETEADRVRGERAQYAERLEAMKTFLETNMGAEPEWETLKQKDPAEYAVKFADWQRQQAAKDKVMAEQERVRQQQIRDQQTQFQAKIAQERELLLEALPDWKNPDVAKKEQEALIAYGTSLGFTDEDLGSLYDHRAVLILQKARLYDEAQKKGKTVLKEKAVNAPVLKPGSPAQPKPKSDASDVALKRFQKTHRPQDAAALIEHLLAREGP